MKSTLDIPISVPDDYLLMYRLLASARALEEEIARRAGNELFGPVLTGFGQEVVAVASLFALHKLGILDSSFINVDHRTVYAAARKEAAILDLLRNYFARATGGNKGRDGNVHWCFLKENILGLVCSDMGRAPGIAVGMAEEMRRLVWPKLPKEKRPVTICFFGDGAAQQGGVHEAMNWVAASNCCRTNEELSRIDEKFLDEITKETGVVRGAPVIFVINDNQLALFTDAADEHGRSDLSKRALGYGNMIGVDVDGTDPVAMFNAIVKAVSRAQSLQSTLVVARNYRLTGHNEMQIRRNPDSVARGDFFDVNHVFGLHTPEQKEEFKNAIQKEPVFHGWSNWLIDKGYADRAGLDRIMEEERIYIKGLVERVRSEPKITIKEHAQDISVFPPFPQENVSTNNLHNASGTERLGYNVSFQSVVRMLLREDERVIYFGEDVASKEGGVLGLTRGILKEFGPVRIFNTPISEEAIIASAAGRALAGGKPMCEFQFAPFFGDGVPVFAHAIAPQWYQKNIKYGLIAIFPCGVVHGGGSGHYHESWPERFLIPMEGIMIVAPSNAYEVVGLLRSAYLFEGPVAFLLQTSAGTLSEFESDVPTTPYAIPLGKANILRYGNDVTVVTYGAACVAAAKNEAEMLLQEGISVEVIDLRTVHPWDFGTIKRSVFKTRRCVIFHEDYCEHGVGSMLAGALAKDKELCEVQGLKLKIDVVGASEMFVPGDLELVWNRLPYKRAGEGRDTKHISPKLASAIKELVKSDGTDEKKTSEKSIPHDKNGYVYPQGEVPISTPLIRKVTARRLTERFASDEVTIDVTLLRQFLKNYSQETDNAPIKKLRLDHVFLFLTAQLLHKPEFNVLNGYWNETREEMVLCNDINLGFAVNTKRGLMVPVIHKTNELSFLELAQRFEDIVKCVAENKFADVDFKDLTCTVNNSGRMGGERPGPIVPRAERKDGALRPTTMILALGKVMSQGDERIIITRKTEHMKLVVRFDHHMVDASGPVGCISAIKDFIESKKNPDDFNVLLSEQFSL